MTLDILLCVVAKNGHATSMNANTRRMVLLEEVFPLNSCLALEKVLRQKRVRRHLMNGIVKVH